MTASQALVATVALMLAAILIPVPAGGRAILWMVMLCGLLLLWMSIGVGNLAAIFS